MSSGHKAGFAGTPDSKGSGGRSAAELSVTATCALRNSVDYIQSESLLSQEALHPINITRRGKDLVFDCNSDTLIIQDE